MGLFDFLKSIPMPKAQDPTYLSLQLTEKQQAELTPAKRIQNLLYAGAIVGGVSALAVAPALIGRAVVSLIPKTIGGKVTAVSTGLIATGVLATSGKARKAVVDIPSKLIGTGAKVGGIIEGKDSKLTVGEGFSLGSALIGGVAGAVLGAGGVAIYNKLTEQETPTTPQTSIPTTALNEASLGSPISPAHTGATQRRYRRRKPKVVPSVRVQVQQNVAQSVRQYNTKSIKRRVAIQEYGYS